MVFASQKINKAWNLITQASHRSHHSKICPGMDITRDQYRHVSDASGSCKMLIYFKVYDFSDLDCFLMALFRVNFINVYCGHWTIRFAVVRKSMSGMLNTLKARRNGVENSTGQSWTVNYISSRLRHDVVRWIVQICGPAGYRAWLAVS